uniref:CCHC-type domain-containing protein n=1 Tax=Takifugu rubripes TaxID=31033 RepID=A0A674NZQ4_TAKRU
LSAGVAIRGENTPVFPLSNPARSVVVSNVPPFIKNEMLLKELSRHGRIVSPMRYFVLGVKSPLLRHVVSFRRHVVMVFNNNEKELKLALCFRVDGFDYTVYVTTESQKCFGCGEEGHLVRSCPHGAEARRPADPPVNAAPRAHDEGREAAQTTPPALPRPCEDVHEDGEIRRARFHTDRETYRLKKMLVKIRSQFESAD